MHIGIVPHTGKEAALALTKVLENFLGQREVPYEVVTQPTEANLGKFDVIIVLGGDGTLLSTARLGQYSTGTHLWRKCRPFRVPH